jgi:hypothetical protein
MERRVRYAKVIMNAELQGEESQLKFYNLLSPSILVYESEYCESWLIKADIIDETQLKTAETR